MNAARFLTVAFASLALIVSAGPGCSDDPPDPFNGGPRRDGGTDGDNGSSGGNEQICLLNNCDRDRDCQDCGDGATVCLQSEHRCIACGPNANGKNCGPGQTCTKYGNCVGPGVACAEDPNGVPTITCKNTADCGACGPKFRVCDEAAGKCVGCSPTNTVNCQSTDVCKPDGTCAPKCPAECKEDADCGECGTAARPAKACNKHVCAECSVTKPCANGDKCDLDHGTCVKQCGLGRPGMSNCSEKGNCAGCTGTTECKLPVNGGEGVCATPAVGCEDLGKGTIVLPDPFSRVTQTCSTDANCAGASIDLNVGKILRDTTGLELFKDGSLKYGLGACANIEVFDKTCGLCVPCKQDTDCTDISITQVAGDVLGPLGEIGSAILLDKAFGPNDRKIHMFCQNVAGNYGVCLPCPNILGRCAQTKDEVPPTGNCDHDICTPGTALGLNCGVPGSACVAEVCAKDPYCCTKEWDMQCKADVDLYCKDKTCEPDKCIFRPAGWYCFTDRTKGGYLCKGDGTNPETADGLQCATGTVCRAEKEDEPKSPAVLCTAEGEGCPASSLGKPKCFPN